MEPATLVSGALAVVFALVALLQWRRAGGLDSRAGELDARVRELEAELAKARAPKALPEPAAPSEPALPVPSEPALPAPSEPEPPASVAPPPEEDDEDEPTPLPALPPRAAPVAEEPAPPPSSEPDPLRLEALKVVAEAFELSRYLDFDFIVEKPSTYRVTVPLTSANGRGVRYLQDGMFPCLKQVRVEDGKAILHIDTSKGPP